MTYLEWNDLIAAYFFNVRMTGREVLLAVDEQAITELGKPLGIGLEEFIKATLQGPDFIMPDRKIGLCEQAYYTCRNWRKRMLKYPPYIGYLSLFVLAGCMENGNYSTIAYYPKLRSLLREPPASGPYLHFDRMSELWEDLEKWSREDKLEELGRFTVKIRGSWRHVGLPLSQSVLSSKERRQLPLLFYKTEMLASDVPQGRRLNALLLEHGQDLLFPKTIRLLNGQEDNQQLLQALYELIQSELEMWDGSIPEGIGTETGFGTISRPDTVLSAAKLCVSLDNVAKAAKFTVRINSNNSFPEEPLSIQVRGQQRMLSCTGSFERWSTELRDDKNQLVDGTSFELLLGELFDDKTRNWTVKLKGAHIRIFAKGQKFGLQNDYVEVSRLDRGSQFMILCPTLFSNTIKEWGGKHCDRFAMLNYRGIPDGWVLLAGNNPKESCLGYEALTLSSQVNAKLIGGLKVGNGNTYLHGYLPNVVVENLGADATVLLQDIPLTYDEDTECWPLPENLPLHTTLALRILDESGTEARRFMIQIAQPSISIPDVETYLYHAVGKQESIPAFLGSHLISNDAMPVTAYPVPLPAHLSFEMILIGRIPGQVYHFLEPSKPNLDWRPVWAIVKAGRNNWQVHYCSTERNVVSSSPAKVSGDEPCLKQWKEAIQTMDRRIGATAFPFQAVTELWRKYVEVAMHA